MNAFVFEKAEVENDMGDKFQVTVRLKKESAHYRVRSVFNSAAIRKAKAAGLPESFVGGYTVTWKGGAR